MGTSERFPAQRNTDILRCLSYETMSSWMTNMKKVMISTLTVLLLQGCAISREDARAMTSYDLCKILYDYRSNGNSRSVALREVQARGYDCNQDKETILRSIDQELSQVRALGNSGAILLQTPQQTTTNCTYLGGGRYQCTTR